MQMPTALQQRHSLLLRCFDMKRSSNQQGFTLIELMISLALSMLAALAVIALFSSQNQTFRSNNAVSDLQETGRIALDILSQDIRMAGYQGCTRHLPDPNDPDSASQVSVVTAASTDDMDFRALAVRGYDTTSATWVADAAADVDIQNVATKVKAGTDVIAIKFADFQESLPTAATSAADGTLTLLDDSVASQILLGDQFIITDCTKANIVTRTNAPTTGGALTFDGTLSGGFDANSEIQKFNNNIYFVGDTFNPARTMPDGTPIAALFVSNGELDAAGTLIATELLAGVENLQLTYGTGTSNSMQFNNAADIAPTDFDQIASVKVGLLAASTEYTRTSDDEKSYTLAGITIASSGGTAHGNDRRMRRRFNTSISIRNRRAEF